MSTSDTRTWPLCPQSDIHVSVWPLRQPFAKEQRDRSIAKGPVALDRGRGEVEQGGCWERAVGWGPRHAPLQLRRCSRAGEAGGCRSVERGSGACLLAAASASHPLGSERAITNSRSLFQHKQDLQRVWSLSGFVFFFFLCPPKKIKAERPTL